MVSTAMASTVAPSPLLSGETYCGNAGVLEKRR